MRLPIFARIRAFFARDQYSFWWNEFTDRDKELSRLSTRQLAQELNKARTNKDGEEQIIIEHLLSQRLAQMQSNASWGSGVLGFIGAIIGAALSVSMSSAFQERHEQIKCVCECANYGTVQKPIQRPVQVELPKIPSGNITDIPGKKHEQAEGQPKRNGNP